MGDGLARPAFGHAYTDGETRRISVLLGGLVQWGDELSPVRIRQLSCAGARVESASIPPVGSVVRFSRGMAMVTARVAAAGRDGFELMFGRIIGENELRIFLSGTSLTIADDDAALPISKN